MSGAVVQDEDWDRLEHSGRFSSVMSYPFWGEKTERGTQRFSHVSRFPSGTGVD